PAARVRPRRPRQDLPPVRRADHAGDRADLPGDGVARPAPPRGDRRRHRRRALPARRHAVDRRQGDVRGEPRRPRADPRPRVDRGPDRHPGPSAGEAGRAGPGHGPGRRRAAVPAARPVPRRAAGGDPMNIDRDGVTISFDDTGDGTPVVLLHGWPDERGLWRHQVPALAAAGYRVIAPDLRGFGASSKPTDVAAYAMDRIIGDVVGVLDALGIDSAHLVGHDWGAAIAWYTATFAPDRVRSLTAISVGHPASFRAVGLPQREKSWYMLL